MKKATIGALLALLPCSGCGDDDAPAPPADECRLHPVYDLRVSGCGLPFMTRTWCTGGVSGSCNYAPEAPVCIDSLCLEDVSLQCEHAPPSASCAGSPCAEDLAYRCTGTAQVDGCTVMLDATMGENFPGTCS